MNVNYDLADEFLGSLNADEGLVTRQMANGREVKIRTEFVYPPVPWRHDDWSAVTDDYDGAEDAPNRYQIGRGATEQEAIDDLLSILEEGGE